MNYRIGDVLVGQVTGIQPYGVFILLDDQTQGLVHISECSAGYVEDLHEVVHVGDVVKVLVLDIDEYSQKISLSLRALMDNSPTDNFYHSKKFFWTSQHTTTGFKAISNVKEQWISEALSFFG
ncbi:CvfD/Ygs/GSP13 family RNA-binding post-transcriptional regulator [Lapidilactobacillus bayanensis]|uniref:CvfD/Ygs/GSP13 family RNA-binding post-transcriptional regulator n=1 Tax=Lapidilactobacillus bayanensis TaxID=2485998 RepID=UPI000F7A9839|nr:CvfD/Ygs/GSP13 family RNA-binding post-transcriptional regulator [Lapidilactobacillus bayanensis]